MLTQLNFPRTPFVSILFFCTVAFVMLKNPVFALDTTNGGNMTVLSMEEMQSIAGGPTYPGPNWKKEVKACQGFWSCPGKSKRTHRTCSCTAPPRSTPCSTHYNGTPLWEWFHCKRNWLLQCSIDVATGARGGDRYKCNK